MLPAWKSGCQSLGITKSGSVGVMCEIADMYFRRREVWALGSFWIELTNCHGLGIGAWEAA